MQTYKWLSIGAVALALFAIMLGFSSDQSESRGSLADKVLASGTIRVGYVVYPPNLIKDPSTGVLSGIAYDVVEQAAKNLGLKTEWVEEVGWGSMIEGLRTERYDMIGTLIWPNSARAREAAFSTPVMYSVVYPYVRSGDVRFDATLSKMSDAGVKLATIDGEMTSFIAQNDFPKAKTYALTQNSSVSEVLVGVTSGKADVTFVEPAIANDFLKNNPSAIRRVGSVPVRTFGNVFAVARGEDEFLGMWNTAIRELIFDGTIKRAVEKYSADGSFLPTQSPVGNQW
jgi:polar amino acid transport system substrate-binding protein